MTTITLTYKAIPSINWKMVYAILIVVCFALAILYILSINQLTRGAYLIANYNKELNMLAKENRTIQAEYAESGFLDHMYSKVNNLGFEKAHDIKYVEIFNNSLAKAE